MGLLGNAVLVNCGGIVEYKEIEYNECHSKDHMPEVISLPGILRGLRAVGISDTHLDYKYFNSTRFVINEKNSSYWIRYSWHLYCFRID